MVLNYSELSCSILNINKSAWVKNLIFFFFQEPKLHFVTASVHVVLSPHHEMLDVILRNNDFIKKVSNTRNSDTRRFKVVPLLNVEGKANDWWYLLFFLPCPKISSSTLDPAQELNSII